MSAPSKGFERLAELIEDILERVTKISEKLDTKLGGE